MVVCKCRKFLDLESRIGWEATRLYCFVHKVPVCGECICFAEHQICVVKKYSDWVVDGEYDWPPTCSLCHATLEDGADRTTRLGCLHVMHTNCLVSHIKSFPPQTAPAGYVCAACSSPIWPPINIKDTGSHFHSRLKEAIIQSGLEKNVFGNHIVSLPALDNRVPSAFASDQSTNVVGVADAGKSRDPSNFDKDSRFQSDKVYSSTIGIGSLKPIESEIVEMDVPSASENKFLSTEEPNFMTSSSSVGPSTTARKASYLVDRQNSDISYYADDEDGKHKKYTRRGPFHHKFLRMLLPFWSTALPTLPVTAPSRKDSNTVDVPEGRARHQRSSRIDLRKLLLIMAIMACMATMGILYYRLAQRSFDESLPEDELQ